MEFPFDNFLARAPRTASVRLAKAGIGRKLGSLGPNSLLTGKITGKFSIFGAFGEKRLRNRPLFQSITDKFPQTQNREIIRLIREWYSSELGIIARKGGI
jgi:hypothetical protein